MSSVDVKEVVDTIYYAKKYLGKLNQLDRELQTAEKQISSSAESAEKEIEVVFTHLIEQVTKILGERKQLLVEKTRKVRDASLVPLRSSRLVVADKLRETGALIESGKRIDGTNVEEFTQKSSLLGSLPEVPELKEVSYITFQHDPREEERFVRLCRDFGGVSRIAPVQICTLASKPGAILVEWEILDSDEPYAEIQEYHLQKALGNIKKNDGIVFNDCYKGSELQFLAQDLKPRQDYSFRIRCKFEGCSDYSPWSIAQISSTNIEPYCWGESSGFKLSNERKIATSTKKGYVLSDGPQFNVGNTLDYTFVEVGEKLKDNFIGLVQLEDKTDGFELDVNKEGSFLLEATGEVYIDGSLKSTRLPPIRVGSKVSFMCTALGDDRIRMNIDVSDKRVTYDWNIDVKSIYFVGRFAAANWKVLVE